MSAGAAQFWQYVKQVCQHTSNQVEQTAWPCTDPSYKLQSLRLVQNRQAWMTPEGPKSVVQKAKLSEENRSRVLQGF